MRVLMVLLRGYDNVFLISIWKRNIETAHLPIGIGAHDGGIN